jgi:LacI family transcriptional regulator, galactose operon repressor
MASRREVALIVDAGSPYDRRIIRGVASYVVRNRREWSLYVEEDLAGRLPNLRTWGGDGIIASFDNRRVASAVSRMRVPVVGVGGGYGYYQPDSLIPYVRTDNGGIAEMAAEHLIGLGVRQFAVCGYLPSRINGWSRERIEAFRQIVEGDGYKCHVFTGRHSSVENWKQSQLTLKQWLQSLPKPIGLFACDDSRARHVLQACKMGGVQVPEEIALVGVDNDDLMCEISDPTLTSIEQGSVRVGYEAASLLDRMMHGKAVRRDGKTVAPERLVARRSTDITAVADPNVAEALQFIRQHACGPIKVRHVLKTVKLSRSNLEGKFRNVLGRSVHAEIGRVRVETAKHLLTSTSVPIKEVAQRVGVSSVQYFTVMMRSATGRTPGQLRKSNLR